jgi:hypothetical protein
VLDSGSSYLRRELRAPLASVVVPARGDPNLAVDDFIDEPVLIGDPPRPVAVEAVLERFGFAESLVAIAIHIADQCAVLGGTARGFVGCRRLSNAPALVAQRIEHLTTDQKVGGSSPSERAMPCICRSGPCSQERARPCVAVRGPAWFGAQWERVPGDREVAEQTITILENRRVLFGERQLEDHRYCLSSVNEIRHVLTAQINAAG